MPPARPQIFSNAESFLDRLSAHETPCRLGRMAAISGRLLRFPASEKGPLAISRAGLLKSIEDRLR